MTDNDAPRPDQGFSAPESTPVSVVGYPDQPAIAAAPVTPGLAGVRMAVSSVRIIAVIALVVAVIVAAIGIIGLVLLRGQVSDLQGQLEDLSAQQADIAAQLAAAPVPQAPEAGAQEIPQLPEAPSVPEDIAAPAGVDATGAVILGNPDASNVVEVYVDYQCPFCQRWEAEVGATLANRAQQEGSDLLIKQYNLAFLGETSPSLDPPGASARAASAALCVLEGEGPDVFSTYNAEVFAMADPTEPPTQFSTEVMGELAASIGASDATLSCIAQERHVPYVALTTQVGFGRGVQGTPTVIVNGRTVESAFSDTELLNLMSGVN